ncbi:MAG: hypothetical protein AAF184_16735 [Pseudomonadota bacterium]
MGHDAFAWRAGVSLVGALLACSAASCGAAESAAGIEHRDFEVKVISRGDNRPPINLAQTHGDRVLVLAKEGASESEIRGHRFADGTDAGTTLDTLLDHGFISREGSAGLSPTVAVMTLTAVSRDMPVDESVIAQTVEAIHAYAPAAFEALAGLEGFSHLTRGQYDLFLLSNGLLDNFQIANVEAQVIASERPARAGGHYYLSVQEKAAGAVGEAFGIYGNHTGRYGPYILGVYGNQRNQRTDFHRMPKALIGAGETADDSALQIRRRQLVDTLGALWFEQEEVVGEARQTLERLGFVSATGALMIPVITTANYGRFSAVVADFTPTLIAILNGHLPSLKARYADSSYAGEITFEEFFMWWFHLYYSAVTDALVADGTIHIPPQGVATYLMIPGDAGGSTR